jgi:acetyltransferase-like isoleucine patch superfamily enzyme
MSEKSEHKNFYPLRAGAIFAGDWHKGSIPENIEVGENTVIDSSFSFKNYFSTLPVGLRVGNNVTFWRTSLAAEENGLIEIGDNCYIANASLVCSERISIGSNALIAGGVTIADSDFHPVAPAARLADTIAISAVGNRAKRPLISTKPVVIEDDVWIGYNATILKGVRIGTGAVISAGALVIEDVPPFTEVAGNPAKVVMK